MRLRCQGVTKHYTTRGKVFHALDPISLDVRKGEFVTLIGPSGCGKSTLLGMVAGLTAPSSGYLTLEGRPLQGPSLDRGVVFQHHALLPWLTALENIVFALDSVMPGAGAAEKRTAARRYLELVKLGHAADKKPSELSGGMKQRVGIARAFAVNPKVLLLDEPFGALDALTRAHLQDELLAIWENDRKTVLLVTHDVDEALYLSDRIAVFSHGPSARIRTVMSVDFPRPRTREALLADPTYHRLRRDLVALLHQEMAAQVGD